MKFNVNVNVKTDDRKAIEGAKKVLAQAMHIMEGEAVRHCPVDTGRLRASIHLNKLNDFHWILADGTDYGKFQEFGTIKMKAQPFFRPALSYTKQMVPILINKHLK